MKTTKFIVSEKSKGVEMKMNRIFSIALLLSILLSSGCAASVSAPVVPEVAVQAGTLPLGAQATVTGIRAVLAEMPGTFIMQSENMFLLAWPKGSSYAYVFLGKGTLDLNGLKSNTINVTNMVKYLEGGGWKYVPVSALPAKVLQVLGSYTVEMVVAGASTLTTVFVLPVFLIDGEFMQSYSIQYPMEQIQ